MGRRSFPAAAHYEPEEGITQCWKTRRWPFTKIGSRSEADRTFQCNQEESRPESEDKQIRRRYTMPGRAQDHGAESSKSAKLGLIVTVDNGGILFTRCTTRTPQDECLRFFQRSDCRVNRYSRHSRGSLLKASGESVFRTLLLRCG